MTNSGTGGQLSAFTSQAYDIIEYVEWDSDGDSLVRSVVRREGGVSETAMSAALSNGGEVDPAEAFDQAWLQADRQPKLRGRRKVVRLVDLFSGCGGMTLGVMEAARALGMRLRPVLAVDIDENSREVYSRNFAWGTEGVGSNLGDVDTRRLSVLSDPIEEVLPGELGTELQPVERELKERLGPIDVLVGGPPCQGHSNLNNHTRRNDSRNALFAKMARFAEVVRPRHIIVENVSGVLHDKDGVFDRTRAALKALDYKVTDGTLHAELLGVPQRRHRVFMVASLDHHVDLALLEQRYRVPERTVDWAIADLIELSENGAFNQTTSPTAITHRRIEYLFEEDVYNLPDELRPACHRDKPHTYPSVYGRIFPNQPAQTITTGFQVMGQGRFVHPHLPRTLTPHEGARLQFFPDWFEFGGLSRKAYGQLIGNAVPPKLVYVVALDLLR